jgi:hypothetical protein
MPMPRQPTYEEIVAWVRTEATNADREWMLLEAFDSIKSPAVRREMVEFIISRAATLDTPLSGACMRQFFDLLTAEERAALTRREIDVLLA